jgi:2-methylfumaryl-CoA isomerase
MATGVAGADPVGHVLPAWDLITGQIVVNTLLAAERHRLRTGQGQLAELSLKDVAAGVMGHLGIIGEVLVNGVDRPRVGNALYGAYGQDFVCADGQRVMVIGLTDRQWRGLVKVTAVDLSHLGDLSAEGARWHARDDITAALAPWFAARPVAVIAPLFDAAGLTWSLYRSFAQAVQQDTDLSVDNPMFALVDQPGIGTYPMPGSPVMSSALDRMAVLPAPRLGEHSEAVLADVLGLASGQIARLVDRGVIGIVA